MGCTADPLEASAARRPGSASRVEGVSRARRGNDGGPKGRDAKGGSMRKHDNAVGHFQMAGDARNRLPSGLHQTSPSFYPHPRWVSFAWKSTTQDVGVHHISATKAEIPCSQLRAECPARCPPQYLSRSFSAAAIGFVEVRRPARILRCSAAPHGAAAPPRSSIDLRRYAANLSCVRCDLADSKPDINPASLSLHRNPEMANVDMRETIGPGVLRAIHGKASFTEHRLTAYQVLQRPARVLRAIQLSDP